MEDSVMKKEKRADSSGDEESGCRKEEVSAAKVWMSSMAFNYGFNC